MAVEPDAVEGAKRAQFVIGEIPKSPNNAIALTLICLIVLLLTLCFQKSNFSGLMYQEAKANKLANKDNWIAEAQMGAKRGEPQTESLPLPPNCLPLELPLRSG